MLAVTSVESVLWEEDGDWGGEGKSESVEVICESEVSIILAFRVRISRICRLRLGSAGPSAFCLVLAVWGHVIPLDLSTVGRDRGPIPSDIDRGELFLRGAARGLLGPLGASATAPMDREQGRIDLSHYVSSPTTSRGGSHHVLLHEA